MKLRLALLFSLAALALSSCTKGLEPFVNNGPSDRAERKGTAGLHFEDVVILYSEGYNDLTGYLNTNFDQLDEGYIPGRYDNKALVVYSHAAVDRWDWKTKTEPVVFRVYKQYDKVVRDTVFTYSSEAITMAPDFMSQVMTDIKDKYPSDSYGLVYTSHGMGWIPKDYSKSEELNVVKSVGAQYDGEYKSHQVYQLDLDEFAAALPYHLDYIVMDACLMGGVEVVYEWRDLCDYMVASPGEVLADGFDYINLSRRLLGGDEPDLVGVCDDFYNMNLNGGDATVALYDCSKIEALAQACIPVFEAHRDNLATIKISEVQSFNFSYSYHYDFRDILVKLGATDEELKPVDAALSELVLHKKATDYFLNNKIVTYSGLSMFLPVSRWKSLTQRYKSTSWNIATGFVK